MTDAAAVPAGLWYASYLQSLDPTAVVADLELVPPETAYALVGLAQFVALLFSIVLFIRWFHLAHTNLKHLSASAAHASSWTIWGFFVPVLNLFRPLQLMREIWTLTSRRWEQEPSRVAGLSRPTDRVNLWWGLFLATGLIGNAAGRASWSATTAQQTLWATYGTVAADAFDIGAAAVAVLLVGSVTLLQRPLLDHAPPGPG